MRLFGSFNRDPSGSAGSKACTSHAFPDADGSRLNGEARGGSQSRTDFNPFKPEKTPFYVLPQALDAPAQIAYLLRLSHPAFGKLGSDYRGPRHC